MKLTIVAALLLGVAALIATADDVQVATDAPAGKDGPARYFKKVPPGAHGRSKRAATCGAQTKMTAAQAAESVYAHNLFRSQEPAANMKTLVWDDEMASVAQAWANQCQWQHGMLYDCSGNRIGQNLFVEASNGGFPAMNVTGVCYAWYNEKKDFSFSSQTCAAGQICGHYTQLAWAGSKKVGCAYNQCPTMVVGGATWTNALFVVCDYTPPGNVDGNTMYISGSPCSNCDSDNTGAGYKCVKNQCTACTPATDSACKCGTTQTCQNGGTWVAANCACSCPKAFYGNNCENACTCGDVDPDSCADWSSFCTDPSYSDFMVSNCKATCKYPCVLPPSCS